MIGNGQDAGRIKYANLLFTILVGASKDDIYGKKINNFIPNLFAQYHDAFLKHYNKSDEEEETSEYLD